MGKWRVETLQMAGKAYCRFHSYSDSDSDSDMRISEMLDGSRPLNLVRFGQHHPRTESLQDLKLYIEAVSELQR